MGILDGKAAVVTGSGRGIGKGHALQLAKKGDHFFAGYRMFVNGQKQPALRGDCSDEG